MNTSPTWATQSRTEAVDGKTKPQNVVQFIETNQHRFYTRERKASAWVGVRTSAADNKFLPTYADGIWKDNLLALDECSA